MQDPEACKGGTHPTRFEQPGPLVQPSSRSGYSPTPLGRAGCCFTGQEEKENGLTALLPPGDVAGRSLSPSSTRDLGESHEFSPGDPGFYLL